MIKTAGVVADHLVKQVKGWDKKRQENSKLRGMIAGNMRNVLEVAIKYVGAIGTFIQHNPEESSLVLGGFMVILKVIILDDVKTESQNLTQVLYSWD